MCQLHQARLDVWTAALNLPASEVVHGAEEEHGVRRFSVVPRQIVQLCPACSRPCGSWHQKRWLENVLDLPLGGQPVRLKVRVFQYECEHCQRPAHPVAGDRRAVAKKKHRQFVAVIIDHTNRRVLDVLESREKAVVKQYLDAGKASGLFAALEEVTTDMWDGYVEAVGEVFAERVRVTIDRFHVMQNFQERLTAARREIQRKLSQQEAQALKGSRWLWLTNTEHLTAEQRRHLDALCRRFPALGQLRHQRESLRRIFEDHRLRTADGGLRRLREWMGEARRLGLEALNGFCQTLENWLDKIANYFLHRSSNGATEGLNHGLRAILWRAFGMGNFKHFRARVLHAFGNCRPE